MPKPIFIVGFPAAAAAESLHQVYLDLDQKLGEEYHVLTYRTNELSDVAFSVLNAINASDIEIADLIKRTREEVTSLLLDKAEVEAKYFAELQSKNNPQ